MSEWNSTRSKWSKLLSSGALFWCSRLVGWFCLCCTSLKRNTEPENIYKPIDFSGSAGPFQHQILCLSIFKTFVILLLREVVYTAIDLADVIVYTISCFLPKLSLQAFRVWKMHPWKFSQNKRLCWLLFSSHVLGFWMLELFSSSGYLLQEFFPFVEVQNSHCYN